MSDNRNGPPYRPGPVIDKRGRIDEECRFHFFGRLPAELRMMIWRAAMPDIEAPVIHHFNGQWVLKHLRATGQGPSWVAPEALTELCMPGLAWANREARQCLTSWMTETGVQMHFRQATEGHYLARPWRSDRDVLFVGDEMWQNFYHHVRMSAREEQRGVIDTGVPNGNLLEVLPAANQDQNEGQADDQEDDDGTQPNLLRIRITGFIAMMDSIRHLALSVTTAVDNSSYILGESILPRLRNCETLYVIWGEPPKEATSTTPETAGFEVQPRWELEPVDYSREARGLDLQAMVDETGLDETSVLEDCIRGIFDNLAISELPERYFDIDTGEVTLPVEAVKAVRVLR